MPAVMWSFIFYMVQLRMNPSLRVVPHPISKYQNDTV